MQAVAWGAGRTARVNSDVLCHDLRRRLVSFAVVSCPGEEKTMPGEQCWFGVGSLRQQKHGEAFEPPVLGSG